MLKDSAIRWILEQLEINGRVQIAPITISHERAWSTVATVPTNSGNLFFKATMPELIYEIQLTEALYQWGMPVPIVVATETEQGWLIMEDSGQPLRNLLQKDGDISQWHTAVSQFAQMQINLVKRKNELLALGILDRQLTKLPALFSTLINDEEAMLIGHPNGLTAEEFDQLHKAKPQFRSLCQRLADFGIPETLHHDDFHDNNIFVKDGRFTFADWGEACIAHPFFSMIIVMRIAAYILKLEEDDPSLAKLRDTYLNQWRDFGDPQKLQAAFQLAQTVGTVNRALTWHMMLNFMDQAERAQEADSVPGWLQEFLKGISSDALPFV